MHINLTIFLFNGIGCGLAKQKKKLRFYFVLLSPFIIFVKRIS